MVEKIEVKRHPGPFIGRDVALAQACAMAVLPVYGTDGPDTQRRIIEHGIGNDHVAVQSALAAVHHLKNSDDFRWLIEAPGPRYLAVQRLTQSHNFEWTNDHDKALKFCSEEQADDFMMALRQMDRILDSHENGGKLSWGKLFAFEPTIGNAKAVEHGWITPTPSKS